MPPSACRHCSTVVENARKIPQFDSRTRSISSVGSPLVRLCGAGVLSGHRFRFNARRPLLDLLQMVVDETRQWSLSTRRSFSVPPPRSAPVHASTAAALQRAPSAIRFSRSACFALKRAFLAARSLASFARSSRVKPPGSLSFLSQATCGAPFYVYSATTSALLP